MTDPLILVSLSSAGLVAVSLAGIAGLRGWTGWLELRRIELERGRRPSPARSELRELRERVRRLEAIASGVDL